MRKCTILADFCNSEILGLRRCQSQDLGSRDCSLYWAICKQELLIGCCACYELCSNYLVSKQ